MSLSLVSPLPSDTNDAVAHLATFFNETKGEKTDLQIINERNHGKKQEISLFPLEFGVKGRIRWS